MWVYTVVLGCVTLMTVKECPRRVFPHSRGPAITLGVMTTMKSSASPRSWDLFRVRDDGTEEAVSEHPDFESGWQAGTAAVHEDRENAYSLYRGGRRVARFCHHRLTSLVGSDWTELLG